MRVFLPFLFLFLATISLSQNYPPRVSIYDIPQEPHVYPPGQPGYLVPDTLTDPRYAGNILTRISDKVVFGVNGPRLGNNYSKDQVWNTDGTLLKLAGYPAAILDGNTYQFLYWRNIPGYGRWSNTQPNIIYGTVGNEFISFDVNTDIRTPIHTFSGYSSVDFGFGEGNQDNNDRYVGLIGRNGSDLTLIVYDIQNDVIVGTRFIGSTGDLDWFSVTPSGNYALAAWRDDGSGAQQGLKRFDIDLTNEYHVTDYTAHSDIGFDSNGDEVVVAFGDNDMWSIRHYLRMVRLSDGLVTPLFHWDASRSFSGIWGGHISMRNNERPGWAYVSEGCCIGHPTMPGDIFAIKLDGSDSIERFCNSNYLRVDYNHEVHASVNRDGTKIVFKSNWADSSWKYDVAPPAWVIEVPQTAAGSPPVANAGNDTTICTGDTITLTASGGGTYLWNTGATTANISVSPSTTTTYWVTVTDANGSDNDTVVVTTDNNLCQNTCGSAYPSQVLLDTVPQEPYTAPAGALPGYLVPDTLTDPKYAGNIVTRVSDPTVFGVTGQRLRNNYSSDGAWNSDGTLLKLSGYPAAILDGSTYQFLYWSNIPSYGRWSNTQPNIIYGTPGNTFRAHDVNTNTGVTLHTFSGYSSIDFGYGEGNQSNDDRYVGLIGENGSDKTLIVYDIQNDVIVGTKFLGSAGNLDWFSVSPLGNYAILSWVDDGSGATQGYKVYDIDLTNERHVYDYTAHGDNGIDASGNEVIVAFGNSTTWATDHSLVMIRLSDGVITPLFEWAGKPNSGIWGGHISCRNINRPGWAYVSEGCCDSHPTMPGEVFAIKLDNSNIVERYCNSNTDETVGAEGHNAKASVSKDGTKIVFASNWFNPALTAETHALAWVVEKSVGTNVSAPTSLVATPATGCDSYTTTLTGSCASGVIRWYTNASDTGVGINSTQTISSNTTFYAKCYDVSEPVTCRYSLSSSVSVTIKNSTTATINNTICQGDSLLFGGVYYKVTGAYTETVTGSNGCDSTTTLNLTVINNITSTVSSSICSTDSLLFGGVYRKTAGTYKDTVLGSNGCDSITTLTLSIDNNLCVTNQPDSLLSFPCARGGGAYTKGGRGGIIVKVTNLNDSGPGSLRAALMMTVPRIIVFDVSGTITLQSRIELILENSNFTVAGQTAPEGGITISNHVIHIGGGWGRPSQPCNNVVFRYVRFRNGRYTGIPDVAEHNGLIISGCDGLVFDHCSFSFCDDQAISMGGDWGDLKNISIQSCIFSENATGIIVGLNPNFPTGNFTSINNLFVDQGHRTPNVGGGLQYDIINNVYFNWGSRLTNINSSTPNVNFIGNYLKPGSYTASGYANKVQNVVPTIYTANNYHTTYYPTPQLDDRDLWQDFYTNNPLASNYFTTTQHPLVGYLPAISTASNTYTTVLSDVGTNKYLNNDGTFGIYQDSFDSLKISNVQNNISSDPFNKTWVLPTLPNNSRSAGYDANNDGIADLWASVNMGGATYNDTAPSGYTWIEEFLNQVDLCGISCSPTSINITDSICSTDSLLFGGVYRKTAGTYKDTVVGSNGCDSITTLTLSIDNNLCSSGPIAFPCAEGYGKNATGGRGGTIVKVTNLNDAGPGSFRDAVSAPNRIVVFEVAGYIDLVSQVNISSNITIAGQTAFRNGGDGITLRKSSSNPFPGTMVNAGSNFIMRYIRLRPGQRFNNDCCGDAMLMYNQNNIILDHISGSYGSDELLDFSESTNITMQDCFFAEPLSEVNPAAGGKLLMITYTENVSILRTLFANSGQRNPLFMPKLSNSTTPVNYEFANNYGFNLGSFGLSFQENGTTPFNANIMNNYWHESVEGYTSRRYVMLNDAPNSKYYVNDENFDSRYRPTATGTAWNLITADAGDYGSNFSLPQNTIYQSLTPFNTPFVTDSVVLVGGLSVWSSFQNTFGASASRDAADIRVINQINANSAPNNNPSTLDENTFGTAYGVLNNMSSVPLDANNNGIEDSWESANMGGANANDIAPSGYTWIEEYINNLPFMTSCGTQCSIITSTISNSICSTDSLLFGGVYRKTAGTYKDTTLGSNGCDSITTLTLSIDNNLCGDEVCFSNLGITVDGVKEALWTNTYYDTLNKLIAGTTSGNSDLYATFNLTWDNTNLYVVAEVTDDIKINDSPGSHWTDDGIEIFIDGNNEKNVAYDANDRQYIFRWNDNTVYEHGFNTGTNPAGVNFVQTNTGTGYIMEASIAWSSIGVTPVNGKIIGFEIQVNDDDDGGTSLEARRSWYALLSPSSDASLMGAIQLTTDTCGVPCNDTAVTINDAICQGDSILFGGTYYKVAGTYTETVTRSYGCDSTTTLILSINSPYNNYVAQTICQGDSLLFNGVYYNSTGIYSDSLKNAVGCDSINTLNLTVENVTTTDIYQTICQGDSLLFNGNYLSTAGTYKDTLQSVNSCDSIIKLILSVGTSVTTNISNTICEGDSVLLGSKYFKTSGTYSDTTISSSGCDSITKLVLTVINTTTSSISNSICQGDSILFGGVYYKTSGTYTETVTGSNGCDSVTTLTLTVITPITVSISNSICQGDSVLFGGVYYKTSGTYTETVTGSNGCDSVTTLTLSVINGVTASISNSICQGDSLLFGGVYYKTSGTYTETVTRSNGCDSVTTLTLSVINGVTASISNSICQGDSLLFGGVYYKTSGTYTETVIGSNGCDSTTTLYLSVNPPLVGYYTQTICYGDSVLFNGVYHTSSGIYSDTLLGSTGCDSVSNLVLIVQPPINTIANTSICQGDSLYFGGVYYNTSGLYKDTLVSFQGCDSIASIYLTVLPPTIVTTQQTICNGDSILVGSIYASSTGLYYDTTIGSNGCDSITYVSLTVLPLQTGTITQTICHGDSIMFGGSYYNTSGQYAETTLGSNGCDSVTTLHLTVSPAIVTLVQDTICEGDSLYFGNSYVSIQGNYSTVYTSSNGCDSTVKLALHVNRLTSIQATSSMDTISVGGTVSFTGTSPSSLAYTWDFGDMSYSTQQNTTHTYNVPGVYTVILEGVLASGCVMYDTLTITVINNVGIEEGNVLAGKVEIYPNPAKDDFYISFDLEEEEKVTIEMYNSKGKLVRQQTNDVQKTKLQIKDTDYERGVYFVKVITGDKFIIKRLILIR